MATKYEMHVYTMGTRAYAEEVCAAIDPDGKIFGGRVLSRDESGSKCHTVSIRVTIHMLNLSTLDTRSHSKESTTIIPFRSVDGGHY